MYKPMTTLSALTFFKLQKTAVSMDFKIMNAFLYIIWCA